MKENPSLGTRYQNRSVAEQKSVDMAWNALMEPQYNLLRMVFFGTESELRSFRQLLVNSVIATDIFDKNLGTMRKNRWSNAFGENIVEQMGTNADGHRDSIDRKATIVIEHLIQASDFAHTMHHVSNMEHPTNLFLERWCLITLNVLSSVARLSEVPQGGMKENCGSSISISFHWQKS